MFYHIIDYFEDVTWLEILLFAGFYLMSDGIMKLLWLMVVYLFMLFMLQGDHYLNQCSVD